MIQWIGAVLIVGACGSCGFSMAARYRNREHSLQQLENALELMQCQMEYRLTELPELCDLLASACTGEISRFFHHLQRGLLENTQVPASMEKAMAQCPSLPQDCRDILTQLGSGLGQLNLSGEIKGIAAAKAEAQRRLSVIRAEKTGRLRSYEALGLCCGSALAILLL